MQPHLESSESAFPSEIYRSKYENFVHTDLVDNFITIKYKVQAFCDIVQLRPALPLGRWIASFQIVRELVFPLSVPAVDMVLLR